MGMYTNFKDGDSFAVLSPFFVEVNVHWDRDQKKFIQCLAPDRCRYCEKNFKTIVRRGAWVYDYQEEGQYRVKVFTYSSDSIHKVLEGVAKKHGSIQACDYTHSISVSSKGKKYACITAIDGNPYWVTNFPDYVKGLWDMYKAREIHKYLCTRVTYVEQCKVLDKEVARSNVAPPPGRTTTAPAGTVSGAVSILNGRSENKSNPQSEGGSTPATTRKVAPVPGVASTGVSSNTSKSSIPVQNAPSGSKFHGGVPANLLPADDDDQVV